MTGSVLAAVVVGGFAVLVGIAWLTGALRTRRTRADIAATYSASGGPVYTAIQIGCAAVLILVGVMIVAGMLLEMAVRR
ncbi:MAG TPA: hypothetical protein VF134_07515 [Candidatus Dormibacteraeota bacterium]